MLSDRDIPVLLSVGVSIVVVADCVCTCPSSKLVWLSRDVASLTRPVYGDELSITGAPSVVASVGKEQINKSECSNMHHIHIQYHSNALHSPSIKDACNSFHPPVLTPNLT